MTIVDRRHAPGGHWLDAYPYVRLHQPSTFYGVSSVPLGQDALDVGGTNAGFYELASASELLSPASSAFKSAWDEATPPAGVPHSKQNLACEGLS